MKATKSLLLMLVVFFIFGAFAYGQEVPMETVVYKGELYSVDRVEERRFPSHIALERTLDGTERQWKKQTWLNPKTGKAISHSKHRSGLQAGTLVLTPMKEVRTKAYHLTTAQNVRRICLEDRRCEKALVKINRLKDADTPVTGRILIFRGLKPYEGQPLKPVEANTTILKTILVSLLAAFVLTFVAIALIRIHKPSTSRTENNINAITPKIPSSPPKLNTPNVASHNNIDSAAVETPPKPEDNTLEVEKEPEKGVPDDRVFGEYLTHYILEPISSEFNPTPHRTEIFSNGAGELEIRFFPRNGTPLLREEYVDKKLKQLGNFGYLKTAFSHCDHGQPGAHAVLTLTNQKQGVER